MNYNSLSNGLRCIGANAHRYQTILRSQSTHDMSPEIHVRNILFAFNHAIGKEGSPPKNILLNVCEQYKHVRTEGTIYRGTILRAILASMVYYECLRHNLLFKPVDIYKWFEVDSQTFSKGDKRLRELLDHGFLSEDIRLIDTEHSYINGYAKKLDMDEEQTSFLIKLMDLVTEKKLLNLNAKSSTRSMCVLYAYLTAIGYPMKTDAFKNAFNYNISTIRTLALELFHSRDVLIPLFNQHGIECDGLRNYRSKSSKVVKNRRRKLGRISLGMVPIEVPGEVSEVMESILVGVEQV
jgi:transcription initiation factor TFIIIB Brf1 subunit/transcription initiation factor TFIIB